MNFWDTFTNLCLARGESATTVMRKIGLSKGNAGRWKSGGGPTLETAERIAKYFDVSLDKLASKNQIPDNCLGYKDC